MGVARERNRLGLLLRTGTWWASFEANPQSARLVFKSSLVLSGKAAKDNFTTEPRSPSRLLGRIAVTCNQGEGLDEVLLQVRWSKQSSIFGVVRQCQRILEVWIQFLNPRLIAGLLGLDGDATASGRLSWLETCSPTQLPALSYAIVPEAKYGFQNNC
ncbi:hypothetical protein ACFQHW_01770 [Lapidilactobacillus achengensis]|uniref:Uncharacterized protein n=1 Tax=Lapidilactobacillus achengensis TaxID=2486000 RepID=A0ABW1UK41_9LACO|nr:hypothetical protein [Lapidilactobacillus achengensis]